MEVYENLSVEPLPNEEWRDIVGYEGLYQISNMGRVKGLPRISHFGNRTKRIPTRILKPTISKRGYYVIGLSKDSKTKTYTIHRLLMKAFVPNPENKRAIDHIDTNKLNNSLSNLRWCTDKENSNNEITKEKNRANGLRMWEEGCFDNRNNTHYRKVAQYTRDGEYIKTWDSIVEVEAALGIDASSISSLCLGTNPKRHTAGGYKWKHVGGHYVKEK